MIAEDKDFPKSVKIRFVLDLTTREAIHAFEERKKAWLKQRNLSSQDALTDSQQGVPKTVKFSLIVHLETAEAAQVFEETVKPILDSNEQLGNAGGIALLEALTPVQKAGGQIYFSDWATSESVPSG